MNEMQRYMFDVQGFLVLRGVLSREEVDTLVKLLETNVDDAGDGDADGRIVRMADGSVRTVDFLDWGQPFRDLLNHPQLIEVLNDLVGPGFRIDHYYGMKHPEGTGLLPLHGGGDRFDSDFFRFRDGKLHCGLTVVSYALTDSPPDSGGFICVPGSHKANFELPGFMDAFREQRLIEFADDPQFVRRIEVNAGDVIVFTEALTHAAHAWPSPDPRWALLYKYTPGWSTWGQYKPLSDEVASLLSPAQRLLFEPPYSHPPRQAITAG